MTSTLADIAREPHVRPDAKVVALLDAGVVLRDIVAPLR